MKPVLPVQKNLFPPIQQKASTGRQEAELGPFEKRLLELAIQHEQSPTEPTTPTLPSELLAYLVRLVSLQMTEDLFSAVAGEENKTDWPVGQGRGFLFPPPLDASGSPFVESNPERPAQKKHPEMETIDSIITEASQTYDVDPALIKAVIRAESNDDPKATSPKGAMGLMQIMPETAQDLGVKKPYEPRANIMGGTRYLKLLLDRYGGNIPLALAAYNWGMGNVEKNPANLPEETRRYIARVNTYYREFET